MPRHSGAAVLAAALLAALGAAAAGGGDKAAEPLDLKVVAAQQKFAVAAWKRALETNPAQHETKHFLLLGTIDGRTLKQAGASLEKATALARKAFDLTKEEAWPGKLAVYFAADRKEFAALVRNIEKRRPDTDERGSAVVRSDTPSVIVGPGKEVYQLSAEGEAAAQVAVALLQAKGGDKIPAWVLEGFGRATALRAGPVEGLAQEYRRAQAVAGKYKARDAWSDSLSAEAAPVLRASLIEYLVYSGRIRPRTYLPFLTGFRPPEEGQAVPTTEAVLEAANIAPARLDGAWQKWVRTVR
jgi:hypothetical protein